MKIGFIGLGNMASAMISGMLEKGIVEPQDIIGSSRTIETMNRIEERFNITTVFDNREVAAKADVLILAVKPQIFPMIIDGIKGSVRAGTLIVSIAAGRTLSYLKEAFGKPELKIVRCMPNTPALVMEACTGVCAGEEVPAQDVDRIVNLMGAFGKAYVVPEKLMDAVVGVSGSSPAYVFMFIEAMADAAVAAGMSRKSAYNFAAQAVLGSAKLVLETGLHPGELKDMVCSPAGTTIEAVRVLEEKGFRGTVMEAVEACVEKSSVLTRSSLN